MPTYHVWLYPIVKVRVSNVEADNQVEAIKKAEQLVNFEALFANLGGPYIDGIAYADDVDGFLVDEAGDSEHVKSTFYDLDFIRWNMT